MRQILLRTGVEKVAPAFCEGWA